MKSTTKLTIACLVVLICILGRAYDRNESKRREYEAAQMAEYMAGRPHKETPDIEDMKRKYGPYPRFFEQARGGVEARLKAPATAVFCHPSEAFYSTGKRGLKVSGWVDSQNSFGAMIRSNWEAEVSAEKVYSVTIAGR